MEGRKYTGNYQQYPNENSFFSFSFGESRIPYFDLKQIHHSAKTSDWRSLLDPLEYIERLHRELKQPLKSKLHYHLLSHSDHPVTRDSILAGCTTCQDSTAASSLHKVSPWKPVEMPFSSVMVALSAACITAGVNWASNCPMWAKPEALLLHSFMFLPVH